MSTFNRLSSQPGWRREAGVVLISVLLILALLSALIYQVVGRQSLVIAQARQTFAGDQALSYALGGESYARQLLFDDWTETGAVDHLAESWAEPLEPFEIDNGFLEIQIRDLNSCFNLNHLAATDKGPAGALVSLQRFQNLLRNAALPDSLGEAWRDWVDANQEISGFGAEDGEYLLADVPYRTADQLAGHVSELMLLAEMDLEYLDVLLPDVCVLPVDTLKLNVNTASAAALASLVASLSVPQLQALTESERAFQDVNQITGEFPDLAATVDALSVSSEYFEVQVRAQVGDSLVELSTLLFRSSTDGMITVLGRDLGKNFRSLFVADEQETDS